MDLEGICDLLMAKSGDLHKGLELLWRRPPHRPNRPLTARPRASWKVWDPLHPAVLRTNRKNWFYADVLFPRRLAGHVLAGRPAYVTINGYCPFTLWLDGEEAFAEQHAWHATGPIADPLVLTIEPGRTYRLVFCAEPTVPPVGINPLAMSVVPLPCIETSVDLAAVASELLLASALARTTRERALVEEAAGRLDIEAVKANRWAKVRDSIAAAEERLRPFSGRARRHTVHLIGHTHIDMDWQWTWEDTVHCIRRDFKSAVEIMNDHPQVTFVMSQVPSYDVARRMDPGVFAEVKRLIREGRWENVAGTWVEGDLNMADGESIARQMLYAADWTRKHLGRRSRVFWAPDTFGHPANMPQLAVLGGHDTYFHWRCNPGGADNWPARIWEGADGTEVLAISSAYGGALRPGPFEYLSLHTLLQSIRFGLTHSHHVWGLGDHGGGLPRHQLALLERYRDRPVMPTFRFSTISRLREAILAERVDLPRNKGLTWPLFEGCFTTHGRMKAYNRQGEGALLAAEALAALAGLNRSDALRSAWIGALFNQFHDILDGAAVHETYRRAYARAENALRAAGKVTREAVARIAAPARGGRTLALINPLGFERSEVVRAALPKRVRALAGADGRVLPVQHRGREAFFVAGEVPAFSRKRVRIVSGRAPAAGGPPVRVTEDAMHFTIETPHCRCKLNRQSGVIGSYYDKRLRRELVGYGVPKHLGHVPVARTDLGLNVFQVIDESPNPMSAWHIHDVRREENLLRGARVELAETGPVFARFRVAHAFRNSTVEEEILFYRDVPRVEFEAAIDWRERGGPDVGVPQLKVAFAASMTAARARYEGPYTVTQRPADGLEWVTQKWADLSGEEFGFALYNDSRYGVDALGSRLRLTLVRNAYGPDPCSDNEVHAVRFAFAPHGPEVSNAALIRAGMAYNRPLVPVRTNGRVRETPPQLTIESANAVVCTALRRAEHSGHLLLRLFETAGRGCRAKVKLGKGITSAEEVNFLEEPVAPRPRLAAGKAALTFRPFEVKTLRLKIKGWKAWRP